MDKNKIETPYAIIDFVLNADKQGDDAKLFAIGIGKDYWIYSLLTVRQSLAEKRKLMPSFRNLKIAHE